MPALNQTALEGEVLPRQTPPAGQGASPLASGTTALDIALAQAALGHQVFPFKLTRKRGSKRWEKTPLVKWTQVATTDEAQIRRWAATWPRAQFGWRLPEGVVVVDVDHQDAFDATERALAPTARQGTVSGGSHWLYSDPDGQARQTTNHDEGFDTRVGGKGWVGLYAIDSFAGPVAPAPDWVLEPSDHVAGPEMDAATPITTRHEITRLMGGWRRAGISEKQILAGLREQFEDGRIASSDPARPWVDADLVKLASEAAKWTPAPPVPDAPLSVRLQGQVDNLDEIDAADLDELDLPEQRWVIPDVMPEGLGVLASAPKIGKTRLSLQVMCAATMGDEVLGKLVERRPVLFYCLENGRRSVQKAFRELRHGRPMPHGLLIRWNALHLHSGLEEEVSAWLDEHPFGLVFIDMLAKVRPSGRPGKTSYDDDYAALTPLHSVATAHPGSTIVILTHDRKAKSEDWATRITGSRGIVGVGDFTLFIDRRWGHHDDGVLRINGRDTGDVEDVPVGWRGGWYTQRDGTLPVRIQRSPTQEKILDWLTINGPAWNAEIAEALGLTRNNVAQRLGDMRLSGDVERTHDGYVRSLVTVITDGDAVTSGDAVTHTPNSLRERKSSRVMVTGDCGDAIAKGTIVDIDESRSKVRHIA